MKTRMFVLGLILFAAGTALAILITPSAQSAPLPGEVQQVHTANYTISGPYSHDNLTVFLIHGEDRMQGKTFLTLKEAMQQKKVIVHETSNVNELAIENVSPEEVYVQSGDIVKGGQQDRVLAYDFIVPPRSGKLPIAAFCVEQGRWSRRGQEVAATFSVSENMLSTTELKLAAKYQHSQQAVWSNVAKVQDQLSANAGAVVALPQSASSLQLTLESAKVKEMAGSYLKQLAPIIDGKTDVIGYAFAINGRVNSADVYASSALFKKLWAKLLEASAVEALAEHQRDRKVAPVTAEAVKDFLVEAENGKPAEKEVAKRITLVTREAEHQLLFETRDRQQHELWIHRNYLMKYSR